jgi:4-amino-4-deoxy-L-arabinose transferase-like glycosyltransferase
MAVADAESRAGAGVHSSRAVLTLVLLGAAVLRLWGVSSGVPSRLGVDEPEIMERAVRIIRTGDFNPHFFDYPSLYIYVQAIVAAARFVVGAVRGEWTSLAEAPTSEFYVWGRVVTALTGTATVWLVYIAGLRWGAPTAGIAAALLAVMPMHVRESHFVLTDIPLTFFVTASFLLSLRASEKGTASAFAWAGAAAGLAVATKYTGAPALLFPLLACSIALPPHTSRRVGAAAAFASATGAFLLAAPYTILDLPGFLNGLAWLSNSYRVTALPEPPAITYLKHLRINFGSPAVLLAAAGLALAIAQLARGAGRVKSALVVVFPIVYYTFISRQPLVYGRYLLPLVPLLCLLIAAAVAAAGHLTASRFSRAAAAVLTVAVVALALIPPLSRSIEFDRSAARTWTNDLTHEWARSHIPPAAKVIVETSEVRLPPGYRVETVKQLRLKPFEEYVKAGAEYLIASSQVYGPYLDAPEKFPAEYGDYIRLFGQAGEVARFTPSNQHPGPEIRILKVNP